MIVHEATKTLTWTTTHHRHIDFITDSQGLVRCATCATLDLTEGLYEHNAEAVCLACATGEYDILILSDKQRAAEAAWRLSGIGTN